MVEGATVDWCTNWFGRSTTWVMSRSLGQVQVEFSRVVWPTGDMIPKTTFAYSSPPSLPPKSSTSYSHYLPPGAAPCPFRSLFVTNVSLLSLRGSSCVRFFILCSNFLPSFLPSFFFLCFSLHSFFVLSNYHQT